MPGLKTLRRISRMKALWRIPVAGLKALRGILMPGLKTLLSILVPGLNALWEISRLKALRGLLILRPDPLGRILRLRALRRKPRILLSGNRITQLQTTISTVDSSLRQLLSTS